MTKGSVCDLVFTAGETVWEPDHTQHEQGKQDVSLKSLPVSDPYTRMTASSRTQPC